MAQFLRRVALPFVLLLLGLPASAFAQLGVTQVTPSEGTIGTLLTITGTGFAVAKPSVSLTQVGVKKKYVLKVLSYSDTSIQAEIRQAAAGVFDVTVKVKKDVTTFASGVTIVGPSIKSLDVTEGFVKDLVTLNGAFLGTKKGKVRVGTKNAKVKSWTMTVVTFEIPKLGAGLFDVNLSNKIAADTSAGALTVKTPPPPLDGKDQLSCKIDGKSFLLSGPTLVSTYSTQVPLTTVSATIVFPQLKSVYIQIPYDFVNGPVPATFTDAPNMFGSYSQAVPGTSGDVSSWSSIVPGGTCTVTVTNKDVANKILSLTFSGTFLLSLGPGAASIEVTEGVCKTHFTAVF